MPRELGPYQGDRAGAEPGLRITWIEAAVPAPPREAASEPGEPGWTPYVLAGLAGVLLMLGTVGWPWWQRVGLWLETRL